MSKRRVAREVEDLSEEVLGELTPPQRLQLFLEANARGNERWIERLYETCPRFQYTMTDIRFTEAVRATQRFAWQAVYELQTFTLQYELLETERTALILAGLGRDEDAPDEELERATGLADAISEQFVALYVAYHTHRRFASEVLGVELEAWLAGHPDGAAVLERVDAALDDPSQQARAEAWLAEVQAAATEDGTEPAEMTLDELVEEFTAALGEVWNDYLTERII